MRILFTKRAAQNYISIKKNLSEEWGDNTVEAFDQKTIDFLDLLSEFPKMGTIELPEKEIRGFQLTKQTRVLYRIRKQSIILLAFFDVRQNPRKKDIK